MSCEQFRAGYLAREEGPDAPHLQLCGTCRAELPYLDQIRGLLSEPSLWEAPPSDRQVIDPIVSERSRRDRRSRWPWAAAAAIALVAATAAVTAVLVGGGRPNWEVAMTGTDHAPGAAATVLGWNEDGGVRMELTATELPPPPAGHYYELWLSAPDRIVSAGSFQAGEAVTLTSGVSRSEVPRLWVTLEPLDGDPAPSDVTVLDSG